MLEIHKLILYRNFEHQETFEHMVRVMNYCENTMGGDQEAMTSLLYDCINEIVEISENHGYEGNLWQNYLTYLLANHENAYSMACEIRGPVEGSINALVLNDFKIFKALFDYDLTILEKKLGFPAVGLLLNYSHVAQRGKLFNKRIRDRICALSKKLGESKDVENFKGVLTEFYKDFGVGKFGLHKAFRVCHAPDGVQIIPITNIAHVHLDDLVGYALQKQKLIENTEAFVRGKQANNCLLFGDAGTGKSSSVKAILNQYYDAGLRMIEIYKHQFQDLSAVIAQIKNRNYKFIIYMDDLSFEEFETEYKYLKAIIEGGLEKKPENVLIYATTNRRHLIREEFADKAGRRDDLHASDTVQEKLSLAARFGVTIFFGGPDKKEFNNIVTALAKRHHITIPTQELIAMANQWELHHGGLSGRTAQQFVDYILGTRQDTEEL